MDGTIVSYGHLVGRLSGFGNLSGELTVPDSVDGRQIYDGDYTVVPQAYDATVLATRNKAMEDDVIVMEIPYYEASNPQGGYTVTIG